MCQSIFLYFPSLFMQRSYSDYISERYSLLFLFFGQVSSLIVFLHLLQHLLLKCEAVSCPKEMGSEFIQSVFTNQSFGTQHRNNRCKLNKRKTRSSCLDTSYIASSYIFLQRVAHKHDIRDSLCQQLDDLREAFLVFRCRRRSYIFGTVEEIVSALLLLHCS